ncbi:amino acid adenylation domain-containing protein [Kitasatospora sp. Ki12]
MTNPADRNPRGREDRLARLTPEQRAAFEARARGRAGAAPATATGSATGSATAAPALPPRDRALPAPLSFGQERLWFVEQLSPASASSTSTSGCG